SAVAFDRAAKAQNPAHRSGLISTYPLGPKAVPVLPARRPIRTNPKRLSDSGASPCPNTGRAKNARQPKSNAIATSEFFKGGSRQTDHQRAAELDTKSRGIPVEVERSSVHGPVDRANRR